jgi:hypothetical protein
VRRRKPLRLSQSAWRAASQTGTGFTGSSCGCARAVSAATPASRRAIDPLSLIFEGEVIEWPDTRAGYGEVRMNAIGEANGKILRVTYTMRGPVVRIITA